MHLNKNFVIAFAGASTAAAAIKSFCIPKTDSTDSKPNAILASFLFISKQWCGRITLNDIGQQFHLVDEYKLNNYIKSSDVCLERMEGM